jgi:hypothetical protein
MSGKMDHRKRLGLAAAVAVLVVAVLIHRKLAPAWTAWQQERQWRAQGGTDPVAQAAALRIRLARLDSTLGQQEQHGWQPVLDRVTRDASAWGSRLAAVLPEHEEQRNDVRLRTLPLSVEGRAEALVNTVAAVERHNPGVRLVSVDLQARTATYNAPRTLSATLYLRSIYP